MQNSTILHNNKLFKLVPPKTLTPCLECYFGDSSNERCLKNSPLCSMGIYKEIKLCKNCIYSKSKYDCTYSCKHNVYNVVTGELLNLSLSPHDNRASNLYCGPEAKWFKEKF